MILQSNSKIVSLREPNLGETYTPSLNIKIKRAMNGDAWATSNPTEHTTVVWEFAALTRQKIIEIFNFIAATKGQEVTVRTVNEVWRGKILTEPISSTELGICNNNFSLQFEGKLNG